MTDKEQAVTALKSAIDVCNAVLAAPAATSQRPPVQPISVLHKDFLSLLSLIHASATKIALSLKPSSPTYRAGLSPVKDMSDHVAALSNCSMLWSVHGATLAKEVSTIVHDIADSAKSFLTIFLTVETTENGRGSDEYLIRTGAFHNLVEMTRGSDGLSKDNRSAVSKVWVRDLQSLEDGMREVTEMIESQDDEKDDQDDGWNELGIESGEKMDGHELERAKQVRALLRLSNALHKRIAVEFLSPSSHESFIMDLDMLPSLSMAWMAASDELVATLYPPQDPGAIEEETLAFQRIIRDIKQLVYGAFPPDESLEDQMAGLALITRWFDTCFQQISKAARVLHSTVGQDTES
ncbi:hypothetical protein C8J56DRAFT_955554 [Mycena floridula]|nr:hypothetical protein C8J56DRAFT_955554 [Mycena floridula]